MSKSRGRVLWICGIVGAIWVAAAVLGFFMAGMRRSNELHLEMHDLQQLTRALKGYAAEHRGALPESLDDMVQSGFAKWKGQGREFFVFFPLRASGQERGQGMVSDPDRFDVAFGVKAIEVTEAGHLKTDAKRYLISPPSESRLPPQAYRDASGDLGKAMREAAGYRGHEQTQIPHAP